MPRGVESEFRAFVAARDWEKLHTPENLAKSITVEAEKARGRSAKHEQL